ncbi:MAG: T9SS type A sorting domain-containing protein [Bacteroidota bacterium]
MRAVLAFAVLLSVAGYVRAQPVPLPAEVRVSVAQGEATMLLVTLTNEQAEAMDYCVSFARPVANGRLSEEALSSACGAPGEVLLVVGEEANGGRPWDPYGFVALPNGRLLTSESSLRGRTFEMTTDLQQVREFEHPRVEEVTTSSSTRGIAYRPDVSTLWWLNIERSAFEEERALLLEGTLAGTPTGVRVEVPIAPTGPDPFESGALVGLAYAPITHTFYWIDTLNRTLWGADTLGTLRPGYPVLVSAYPGLNLGFGVAALPDLATYTPGAGPDTLSHDPDGPRLEFAVGTPGEAGYNRHVVVGPRGENLTPAADGRTPEPLETPLLLPLPGRSSGGVSGGLERSATDPNGAVYYAWSDFDDEGIVMIRPHPVPPGWLTVERWQGTLSAAGEPDAQTEMALWFRPGRRAVGTYRAALQLFDAATEAVVEVPLTMTVTTGTDTEDDAPLPTEAMLSVYPNPTGGTATVSLSVGAATVARVVVYDVLGRAVARLHDGAATARLRLALDTGALPAGVYVVRAETDDTVLTRRLTVVR